MVDDSIPGIQNEPLSGGIMNIRSATLSDCVPRVRSAPPDDSTPRARIIPQDDSMQRVRRVLLARLEAMVVGRAAALGISPNSLRDLVDSIVGEAIAVAISQQDKWDPNKGDFLHWAFLKAKRILSRELMCESRYKKAQQSLQAMAPTVDSKEASTLHEELLEVLEQLSPGYQQALVLYYLHGMTADGLALILNKKTTTVYGLLARARQKARTIWKSIGQTSVEPPTWDDLQVSRVRLTGLVSPEEERRKNLDLRAFIDRLNGPTD